jgi:hypothetical protein
MLDALILQVANGLVPGMLYVLIAIGLSIVFSLLGIGSARRHHIPSDVRPDGSCLPDRCDHRMASTKYHHPP